MQQEYDLSEFSPNAKKIEYDLSEFGPKTKEAEPIVDQPISPKGQKALETIRTSVPNYDVPSLPGAALQVGKDILGGITGLPKAVTEQITNIPKYKEYLKQNISAAYEQITNEPGRAARNVGAGALELGGKISRVPPVLAQYLAHIGMIKPETAETMAKPASAEEMRVYGNKIVGEEEKPGDELLRGIVRNLPELYGAGKLASLPMKLTKGSITESVLNVEKKMKEKYSGEKGLYNALSKEAEKRGITQANINPEKIDLETIKKYTSPKNYEALENLIENKNLTNAQKAISELGYLERRLDSKINLIPSEQDQLQAVRNAKKYIQENMFKDKEGKIHQDLLEKHRKIQEGYANEVVPYTKNSAIKSYKKGELSKDELIQRLSKGKFSAKRGSEHPAIGTRNMIKNVLGSKVGLGAGIYGGYELIKKLLGGD